MKKTIKNNIIKIFLIFIFTCLTMLAQPDPDYSNQWYLQKIKAPLAWEHTTGSNNIMIGVLDSGIPLDNNENLSHPELDTSRIVRGGNYSVSNTGLKDMRGHGTRTAGIIGAKTNNGIGIAGICFNSKLFISKVIADNENIDEGRVLEALKNAISNGCKIINMSFGNLMYDNNGNWRRIVEYARGHDVLIVASAGNIAGSINHVGYPAKYAKDFNNVIAVSAVDSNDNFAFTYPSGRGSCYGPEVTVCAPGVNIYSTIPDYYTTSYNSSQNYVSDHGTSSAAPIVSGIAGLVWSKFPHYTAAQVKQRIISTADDLGTPGHDNYYGYGRVNAHKAVKTVYVPEDYPTLQMALANMHPDDDIAITSGTHTVNNPVVIVGNTSLSIGSGVTVNFNGGLTINGSLSAKDATIKCSSLTVNGNMEVNGLTINCSGPATIGGNFTINGLYSYLTFSQGLTVTGDIISNGLQGSLSQTTRFMIGGNGLIVSSSGFAQFMYTHFYGPGMSSNWGGIAINGGFGSFGDCKIYNSSGKYGISVNNSGTLAMGYTQIASNNCGLNFTSYSSGFIYTNNAFEVSDTNIKGDNCSGINAGDTDRDGKNSFRGGGSYHIHSTYSGTIWAIGNYWAGGTPRITPNVYAPNRQLFDNNPPMIRKGEDNDDNKTEVETELFLRKTVVKNDEPTEKVPGIEELDKATLLLYTEKYDEALVELHKLVDKYKDGFVGKRALVWIDVILERTERNKEILPLLEQYSNGKSKVAQFANYRKGYQYFRLKEYNKGIAIMKATEFSNEDIDLKQMRLFDLGVVYHDVFGNKAEAYNYFNELIKTYPDCPLAEVVNTFYNITKDGYDKPIAKEETTVTETKLFANYPNPFNPSTVIKYQLSEASQVSLKVYDVIGKEVTTLVNSFQNTGSYDVTFNAKNLSSGIYFYKLNVNGKQLINKMLLMK